LPQSRPQQLGIATEFVDDEPCDERLIVGFEHRDCPEQMRQQTTTVDVADQNHRQVRSPRQAHVGQIRCAKVDFGRRSSPLADHRVEFGAQSAQLVDDETRQPVPMRQIPGRGDRVGGFSPDHQLRRSVAAGFEQDRVEPDAGLQAGRPGLHRLRAADLTALDGDHGVVRHVLSLERRDLESLARQQPAQTRHHHRFAGVGAGARDEQGAAHARLLSTGSVTAGSGFRHRCR
jgi:hypothetical protein